MNPALFIGVEYSKATLDVIVITPSDIASIHYHQFSNDIKGFTQLLKWIKQKSERVPQQHWWVIVSRGMQSFDSPRMFACYSGCVPFEHQSGVSARGKSKVHFIANRKIKSLLHMAALSAVAFNAGLKAFYKRKVEAGKN